MHLLAKIMHYIAKITRLFAKLRRLLQKLHVYSQKIVFLATKMKSMGFHTIMYVNGRNYDKKAQYTNEQVLLLWICTQNTHGTLFHLFFLNQQSDI